MPDPVTFGRLPMRWPLADACSREKGSTLHPLSDGIAVRLVV